jgi:hypothetical protein
MAFHLGVRSFCEIELVKIAAAGIKGGITIWAFPPSPKSVHVTEICPSAIDFGL